MRRNLVLSKKLQQFHEVQSPKCEQGWLKLFEMDRKFGQEVYLLKTTPPINKYTCFKIETFAGFSPGEGPLQLNQRWKGGNINLGADSLLTKFKI